MLAAYVSGHGYGHLVRTCEVLRRVRERAPDLPIAVMTAAPPRLVERTVPPPLTVRRLTCDVGLAQRDALDIDEEATVARCRAFDAGLDALADAEAAWLRGAGARLVLGDVPALAFLAAARAGVPAVGLANFGWDWIYRHLARRLPALEAAADRVGRAYASAALLLELPFAGDLGAFPRRAPVGLVARRPRVDRAEARRRLGLGGERRPVALLSFGGIGLPGLAPDRFRPDDPVRWILPAELPEARIDALGLYYPDIVGAADAVVTKPGYGMVTDCVAARVPIVYTDRGDFPEYPIMVAEMGRYLPARHVSAEDLRAGRLAGAVAEAVGLPWPAPPDLDGAGRAAALLLQQSGSRP